MGNQNDTHWYPSAFLCVSLGIELHQNKLQPPYKRSQIRINILVYLINKKELNILPANGPGTSDIAHVHGMENHRQ